MSSPERDSTSSARPNISRRAISLQYNLTVHKDLSIHSNTSYSATGAAMPNVGGSFFLDVNPDPTVSDAQVAVSMYYSDIDVRSSTSVCHMNDSSSNGLYIFVSGVVPLAYVI